MLCQEVHAATVLSLLVVADRHEATELKSTCVKVNLSMCLSLSFVFVSCQNNHMVSLKFFLTPGGD